MLWVANLYNSCSSKKTIVICTCSSQYKDVLPAVYSKLMKFSKIANLMRFSVHYAVQTSSNNLVNFLFLFLACFQSEAEKEKNLILAELEATKQSLQKR